MFEEIMQAIANYGFPIAACIGMFWYMNKEREAHQQESKALNDTINSNQIAMTEALNKNTAAIEKLTMKVGE